MGHINFDKGNKNKRGKNGFYLALAICLVAVVGVAVATFYSTMSNIDTDIDNGNTVSTTKATSPTEEVGKNVTNIPYDRATPAPTTTTSATTPTTTKKAAADLFVLPLTNEILRGFSNNKPVFSPTMNDWRVHNGVDFKGQANQQVKAIADGTVIAIYKDDLWGDVIEIDHGYGIVSRYCGVKAGSIKKNSSVNVGDVIGTLSSVPCESSDGPHLHLEIKVNNEYVNPIEAIGREVKYATTTTAK